LTQSIAEVFNERLSKLHNKMIEYDLDFIFLPVSVNQYYVTGLNLKKSERLTAVIISREKEAIIICPAFELDRIKEQLKLEATTSRILTWEEQEDPYRIVAEFIGLNEHKIGIEATSWFSEYSQLSVYLPKSTFINVQGIFASIRLKKTEWEKQKIIKAINIIDKAREAMLKKLHIGMTEIEASEILRSEAISRGGENPSLHGVHLGINTSFAHGGDQNTTIKEGTPILVDAGVYCDGYRSDITRSTTFGAPPSDYLEIFNIVLKAQKAALSKIKPGIAAESIDYVARQVIEKAGYGKYFNHRLGHGLGMEVHEKPWIGPGQKEPLETGMVFTIEPGIYIPGRFGIRIEDNVFVNENGCEILSKPISGFIAI